jgi:hypothetical protein
MATPDVFVEHPQKRIEWRGGDYVDVDAGIAPLLLALWGRGAPTEFSCQGWETNPNEEGRKTPGYIMFEDAWYAAGFQAVSDEFGVPTVFDRFGERGRVSFLPEDLGRLIEVWV